MQLLEDALDAVHAADAAARPPGEAAVARGDGGLAVGGDHRLNLDSLSVPNHLQGLQVRGGPDELLGDAEAEREVLEIRRRGHHDDVGNAVVDDGHGRLLGHLLRSLLRPAPFPAAGGDLEQRRGVAEPTEAQRVLHLSEIDGHLGDSTLPDRLVMRPGNS